MCMSSVTNYKDNWHTRAYSKWYYAMPGVVCFEQMLKLSVNLLIFWVVNTFSWRHYWPSIKTQLLKFPSACRNNLQRCIFVKEINHWLLVLFLPMFIFCKRIYSQNDETGILEVLEIFFFFATQPSWADLYKRFSKFFLWILQLVIGISVIFLKTKIVKNL